MHKIVYDKYNPKADDAAIIQGDKYRFTILTPSLIRIEYSEEGIFDDRQTQIVLHRKFEVPEFTVFEEEDRLEIMTGHLIVKYDKEAFSTTGLVIQLRDNISNYRSIWYYGDEIETLGGTASTLDKVDGATELRRGLMSQYGFSVIDDSQSAILTKDGWFDQRGITGYEDFYFFGYGLNFKQALSDFYRLSGPQPKIPRYALGNWWSRYYEYDEAGYIDLLDHFDEYYIPFSVAVIDIDWHLVDIPQEYGSGWTGYTWDRELFPNPGRFLAHLKERHYHITLNVHPADGVRPFEEAYEEMADELGVDKENDQYIEFNPMSERFMAAYFKHLHYPNEEMGVDFWWVDWQQGPKSKVASPYPSTQWLLNHYHYSDNQKNNKLGINFSRYSGPGTHRYPIGFSGDSVISWASLNFQPYFTATASNIGYGWWSHDIGGHMHGISDRELFVRWVQLGVFSPINRLHSSKSHFINKEPWMFDDPYRSLIIRYLQLRHHLLPYLYTMNIRAHTLGEPLVQPMYYSHAYEEDAYGVPNQYYFGSELIICPMTKPLNRETLLSDFDAWLPEGIWYDVESGVRYSGNRRRTIHRALANLGVFALEGTIIPLTHMIKFTNSVANPDHLSLYVFTGKDARFELKEDYIGREKVEEGVNTRITYSETDKMLTIHQPEGNLAAVPNQRSWQVVLYGLKVNSAALLNSDNDEINIQGHFNAEKNRTKLQIEAINTNQSFKLRLTDYETVDQEAVITQAIFNYLNKAQIKNDIKDELWEICEKETNVVYKITELMATKISASIIDPILELLLAL